MIKSLNKVLFCFSYINYFLFGGLLILIGLLPNRPFIYGLWGLFFFVINHRIVTNKVIIIIIIFFIYIILLGYYYNIDINNILQFSLQLFFPLSAAATVIPYINNYNYENILKNFIILGYLQLPIVLIQKFGYERLIHYSNINIVKLDFQFGTFWPKNDVAMNFFLILLITCLLFGMDDYFNKTKKYFSLFVYAFTILLSNSKLSILLLIFIISIYLMAKINIKNVLGVALLVILIILILNFTFGEEIMNKIIKGWNQIVSINDRNMDIFLSGGFARGAAMYYYLHKPIILFGDGPTRYVYSHQGQAISLLGLKGHAFIFYAETGIIGLLFSYLLFLSFTNSVIKGKRGIKYFLLISAYTFIVSPLYNLAMLFSWFMIMRIENLYNLEQLKVNNG
jgi:hypothetical protein